MNQIDLKGRVAVVTGAARGIGRAAAIALAEHGADVVGIDIAGEGTSSVFREAGQRSVADVRKIIDVFDL